MEGSAEGTIIASAERLEQICSLPAAERPPLDGSLRGVLAETALTGLQRYEWRLLAPLLHSLIDAVLADFGGQEAEVDGPPRPPPAGYPSLEALQAALHRQLDQHDLAPFTLQRLCEVLLEPRKQYAHLEKVAVAIEKLLMVTSTRQPDPLAHLPPPPLLSALTDVNDNPSSPYLDGRPPQVLDPQQHQALMQQQQQQALAVAQQHLRQPQEQQAGALPNGLEQHEGAVQAQEAPSSEAVAAAAAAAVAAAEAMQLEAAAFVESALADSGGGAAATAGGEGNPAQAQLPEAAAGEAVPQSVPPTPPGQQLQSPGAREQQQVQGAPAEAGPVSMDVDGAAPREHSEQPQPQPQPAAEAEQQGPGSPAPAAAADAAAASADTAMTAPAEQQSEAQQQQAGL
ncbi:serine threonine-phosphatase 4 regulatory subunit 2 [Micractinium conductrix]|uniref:Serine threonine-phosphatase 4 regulatory subunit 2 n=1 Tax=Micractinium conductrix TaxID=554055 RepID=A0A2P6V6G7_9CHLO|nr:serine threonine-phosphatase 4 regulatory subunit 2 [Micractinium conductrix]|eukprot:PSC69679.1 serine threonine-phosphatase 4 regulatory subunit 2 [Micractinium conductrix]